MAVLDDDGFLDREALRALGRARRAEYLAATPYPHAVFDGFLPDAAARRLAEAFPGADHPGFLLRDHAEQRRYAQLQRRGFRGVEPVVRRFLAELVSMAFLDFLEELTGVRGLVADPHFRGAGPLLTPPGGHLALHVDFDRDRTRRLARAITALLYLPVRWEPEWGGELELHPDGAGEVVRLAPLPNRLVVLAHGETHWHGQPNPVSFEAAVPRAVIASYYYVAAELPGEGHAAIWR